MVTVKGSIFGCAVLLLLALMAPVTAAKTPLEAYTDTAQAIVDGFTARETTAFDQVLATEHILDAVFAGLDIEPEWEEGFRAEATPLFARQLSAKMLESIPTNGYAKLLRVWNDGDEGRALIRIDMGDYGNDYLELQMFLDDNGAVRLVDWYDYARGQRMSDSWRQFVAMVAPSETALGKLFDIAIDKKADLEAIDALVALYRQQRYAELVEHFLAMEEEYRSSRLLAVFVLTISGKTNDMQLYQRTLESIAPHFVADDRMALLLLDYYFIKGEYGQVVALTEQLEREFGVEDSGLLVIRANVRIAQGRHREAITHASRAIELEPENEYGYWALLGAQVAVEDFPAAAETAENLERLFHYDMGPDSLGSDATYTGFVASPDYQRWRSSLGR